MWQNLRSCYVNNQTSNLHLWHVCVRINLSFQSVLKNEHFPTSWTYSLAIIILKKCNTHKVGKFRWISLLSSLGKLFTHNRRNFCSDTCGISSDTQGGIFKWMINIRYYICVPWLDNMFVNEGKSLYCTLRRQKGLHLNF